MTKIYKDREMARQTVHIIRESGIPDRIHEKVRELERQFLYVFLLALGCIILTSCSSPVYYNSIKPLSPKPKANFEDFVRVDSVRPTFRWEPVLSESKGEPDFYEFGIWLFLEIRGYDGKGNRATFGRKDSSGEYHQYYGSGMRSRTTMISTGLAVFVSRRPVYAKRVEGCSHTIEIKNDLIPDTKYVWSVRPGWRTDDGVSFGKWATYNTYAYNATFFGGSHYNTYKSCAFPFITPVERGPEPGEIIFRDNFDDNSGNWSIMDTPEISLGISKGTYVMTHKRESGTWFAWQRQSELSESDFEIECDVKHKAGVNNSGYGIIFGFQDEKNLHFFVIVNGGAIGSYMYGKVLDNGTTSVIPWTLHSLIKTGSRRNRLAIRRKNGKLYFMINDQAVNVAEFETFPGNKAGFMVASKQTVEFDNLIVRKIE